MAVGATWITYFAALYLNFCDFSRYAPDKAAVRKGNLWGLPINLVLFSLVAGVTTIAAFKVYGEVLLHPEQISAKFDSWFLALLAALTFAVATLGINVVANFVSPAFDFSNVFPRQIDFKKGGYIAALIALVLYPFAPWEGNAAALRRRIGATMGPLLRRHHGRLLPDRARARSTSQALYHEDGEIPLPGRLERQRAHRRRRSARCSPASCRISPTCCRLVGRLRLVLRRRRSPARSTTCCDRPRWAAASVSPAPDQRSASRKILPPGRIFHVRFRPRKDPSPVGPSRIRLRCERGVRSSYLILLLS